MAFYVCLSGVTSGWPVRRRDQSLGSEKTR